MTLTSRHKFDLDLKKYILKILLYPNFFIFIFTYNVKTTRNFNYVYKLMTLVSKLYKVINERSTCDNGPFKNFPHIIETNKVVITIMLI